MKSSFILVFSFLLTYGLTGQTFEMSVNLGVGSSNYRFVQFGNLTEPLQSGFVPSYGVQLSMGQQLNSRIGINVEPGFLFKGNQGTSLLGFRMNGEESQFHYILPVSMGVDIHRKIKLKLGFEGSYLKSATTKEQLSGNEDNIERLFGRRFEGGLLFGIQYKLSDKYLLGIRYVYGMTYMNRRTFENNLSTASGVGEQFNKYVHFTIGYVL